MTRPEPEAGPDGVWLTHESGRKLYFAAARGWAAETVSNGQRKTLVRRKLDSDIPDPSPITKEWCANYPATAASVINDLAKRIDGQNLEFDLEVLELSNERIDELADHVVRTMPQGLKGFCSYWGWQQFARALLNKYWELNKSTGII